MRYIQKVHRSNRRLPMIYRVLNALDDQRDWSDPCWIQYYKDAIKLVGKIADEMEIEKYQTSLVKYDNKKKN